jgi:curved DNA-binding protein
VSTHYETLGVAKDATPDQIKAAYRRLAKQHHPDLGGDTQRFQDITNAYDVLTDANKRAHYDHTLRGPQAGPGGWSFDVRIDEGGFDPFSHMNDLHGDIFRQFGFTGFNNMQRNRNVRVQLELDLLETLNPCRKVVAFATGQGQDTVELELPAGIHDNTVLTIKGRGDAAIPNIPRGNLEVVVRIRPHDRFTRLNEHLMQDVTIDCFQAMMGTDVTVNTPSGRRLVLSIPAGTQHGTQLGISDEGFPRNGGRGRLIVKISVKIPTALTPRQLELVREIMENRPINS